MDYRLVSVEIMSPIHDDFMIESVVRLLGIPDISTWSDGNCFHLTYYSVKIAEECFKNFTALIGVNTAGISDPDLANVAMVESRKYKIVSKIISYIHTNMSEYGRDRTSSFVKSLAGSHTNAYIDSIIKAPIVKNSKVMDLVNGVEVSPVNLDFACVYKKSDFSNLYTLLQLYFPRLVQLRAIGQASEPYAHTQENANDSASTTTTEYSKIYDYSWLNCKCIKLLYFAVMIAEVLATHLRAHLVKHYSTFNPEFPDEFKYYSRLMSDERKLACAKIVMKIIFDNNLMPELANKNTFKECRESYETSDDMLKAIITRPELECPEILYVEQELC